MVFEEINTPRMKLRKLTPEIYKEIHTSYSDSEIMDFLQITTAAELLQEKEKYQKGLSTHNRSFVYFQLFDISSGKFIGGCGFHTWYTEHFRAEVGYAISDESMKNKGLMSEALNEIINYGFHKMNLNRIEACIGTQNIASQKLVEKFGFAREGLMREHYFKNGTIEDSIIYSLLKKKFVT